MATIPGLSTLAAPASGSLLWIYDSTATPADRSHSIAALASRVKRLNREYKIDSSGGAISLAAFETENLILTGDGASVVTLPEASTCVGYKVRIIAAYPGAALVTITPHTDDHIDLQAANVSIFLNNSDGAANVSKFQYVDLIAVASGYWAVIGGNYCPDQGVDTDGSHAVLGKLHHLPVTNTEDREITSTSIPAGNSWSGAHSVTGSFGVPSGAKAILATVRIVSYAVAAGYTQIVLAFSDNNSNVPTMKTSHPRAECTRVAASAGFIGPDTSQIIIPINSLGQFYARTLYATNASLASSTCAIVVNGYYMGD
jgi:hypothetical protein